jgi:glycosyltransferase involved in cell wall biosynthesis
MSNIAFSILVPTRDRPETLRHTLATVASQPGDDYEIIVADNCGTPETRRVVEETGCSKIRYTRSEEVLPMSENWERGLELCSGEYVTVLGDDDALVPSALPLARRLVGLTHAEIIGWDPHVYWWPSTIAPWYRNLLVVLLGDDAMEISSREVLEKFYAGEVGMRQLPMIYTALFHRGVIEEAKRRYDGFFVPKDTAPDLASGILGMHITERHVRCTRPLSIRGNSAKSTGTAQWLRSLGAEQREKYFREERVGLEGMIHESLVPSPNLSVIVESVKLKCRDAYFPEDPVLDISRERLLAQLLATLNNEPEAYDDNLRDATALAAKLGVTLQASEIPERKLFTRTRVWGPTPNPDGTFSEWTINGDLAGLRHIGDAARLVEAFLTPDQSFYGA